MSAVEKLGRQWTVEHQVGEVARDHPHDDELVAQHKFVAHVQGHEVGSLDVQHDPDERAWVIHGVSVDPSYQRQGIASGLYRAAQDKLGEVQHSYAMTRAGHAWWQQVGGERAGDSQTQVQV